jgi:transposase-like protein
MLYTSEKKLKIVVFAEINGDREAARQFGVAESSVRDWRITKGVLKIMNKKKRAFRTEIPHWLEL